ncbi:hypothetical protein GC089_02985 [Cellulomonas sp. JZ18]|uniref:hypothetical protein n=1 Tax=Cellulomonas sp. JZ18 TaxID=2654191 RepID=UPI0012D39F16|nr:hypothetical protein [Cellulomonas sp. JZ18]QGQ18408.1 hypothetical protein GC089_02985 [Cellulomonas sp. JZ18]
MRRAVSLALAAALLVLLPVGPAHAAPRAAPPGAAVCAAGVTPPVLVPGDVVVLDGCRLPYTIVLGDMHVLATGGRTSVSQGRVGGDVRVVPGGFLQMTGTDVAGGVVLDRALYAWMTDVTVARSVRGTAQWTSLQYSRVHGAVNLATPRTTPERRLTLRGTWVGGWVNLHTGRVLAVGLTAARGLTLSWVEHAAVCGSQVAGDVTVRHPRGAVRVGGRADDGTCVRSSDDPLGAVGGSLLVLDAAKPVVLHRLDVAGDLVCERTPVPVRTTGLHVAGERRGTCA